MFIYMGLSSKSHWNFIKPLATALAERGHELTVVVPFLDANLARFENVRVIKTEADITEIHNVTKIFDGEDAFKIEGYISKILEVSVFLVRKNAITY